jgi:hypothetical protein
MLLCVPFVFCVIAIDQRAARSNRPSADCYLRSLLVAVSCAGGNQIFTAQLASCCFLGMQIFSGCEMDLF